jgi:hypothetical protein
MPVKSSPLPQKFVLLIACLLGAAFIVVETLSGSQPEYRKIPLETLVNLTQARTVKSGEIIYTSDHWGKSY